MSSTHGAPASSPPDEAGFGVVEILVSMFLLLLLAVAFLPLLVEGLKATASNSSVATATQLAAQQLQLARSQPATCGALIAFSGQAIAAVTDPRGTVLQPVRTALSTADCPASYPGTVPITVQVRSGSTVLARASTLILVTG